MSDLLLGLRLYARGAAMVLRSPRLLRLGALPAAVTALFTWPPWWSWAGSWTTWSGC